MATKYNTTISDSQLSPDQYANALLETKVDSGGWKEFFSYDTDFVRACSVPGTRLNIDKLKAQCAVLLENEKRHLHAMDEATRSMTLGGFQDYLFPIIRSAFPVNPILDMVSVQPMTRKIGQVFYMHYKIGQTKGGYTAGSRIFDAQAGYGGGFHYSDEVVENEVLERSGFTLVPSAANNSRLQYAPGGTFGAGNGGIRPGTCAVTFIDNDNTTIRVARDDGNGGWVLSDGAGSSLTGTNTINYLTGAMTITLSLAASANGPVLITYEYDSEGGANLPTLDIEINSSPVLAARRALRYRYSTESAQDFAAEFGMNVDDTLAQGVSGLVTTEQAREVLADLWRAAGPETSTFSLTVSSGLSRREQYADLQFPLSQAMNQMYQDTQKVKPNWMVVDTNFLTVLNTIGAPHFAQWQEAETNNTDLGVKFVGTWNGNVRVYVDSLLDRNPGASTFGNCLMGYKGEDFKDAGYVWAPYRLMYVTPTTTLDDMIARKALASRVGRKLINPRMFKRIALSA